MYRMTLGNSHTALQNTYRYQFQSYNARLVYGGRSAFADEVYRKPG